MIKYETTYDPITKTWSGRPLPTIFHPNANVGQIILYSLARSSSKIGQISFDTGLEMTNQEIQINAIRVAQNFDRLGIRSGDVVAIAAGHHHHLSSVVFGLLALAAPINTLDPNFKTMEIKHMLELTKPKLVICQASNLASIQQALIELNLDIPIYMFGEPTDGVKSVNEILLPTGIEQNFEATPLTDGHHQTAVIVCSSGTTGLSKGVNISHAILLNRLNMTNRYQSDDVHCSFGSINWMTEIISLISPTLNNGSRIITQRPFSAELLLEMIEKHRVTIIFLPSYYFKPLLQCPSAHSTDLSSVKRLYSGGVAVPVTVQHQVRQLLPNCQFMFEYGMSEASGPIALNATQVDSYSVGKLATGMRVRMVNENDELCGPNEEGEILLSCDPPILGYFNDSVKTEEALDSSGWLRTGDVGRFDDDNLLYVVDRKKDLIKYYGSLSPTELEHVINEVDEVVAVCVVGVPGPQSLELPTALVIIRGDEEAAAETKIHALIAERLSDRKKLRGGIFFVKQLPRTRTGKILRREVIKIATALHNERNQV